MNDTPFPRAPRTLRGGLVTLDPLTRAITGVIAFQYNPDTVTRTLKPRAMAAEPGDRLEVLRLAGPPHETIRLEAELDAAEQLESPDDPANAPAVGNGLLPALAALEQLITPQVTDLLATDALFDRGMLEIAPVEAPLLVLVWGAQRVVPVLLTDLSITEEAFNPHLQPIRAKVTIELRVLTTSDLPVSDLGGTLYLSYRRDAEQLAALVQATDVHPLGLEHLP